MTQLEEAVPMAVVAVMMAAGSAKPAGGWVLESAMRSIKSFRVDE